MKEDINKRNESIALFMGATRPVGYDHLQTDNTIYKVPLHGFELISSLKYHSSWDWLMPVVEKIEKEGIDSRICYYQDEENFLCDFVDSENNELACVVSKSKIEAVFIAVSDYCLALSTNIN